MLYFIVIQAGGRPESELLFVVVQKVVDAGGEKSIKYILLTF